MLDVLPAGFDLILRDANGWLGAMVQQVAAIPAAVEVLCISLYQPTSSLVLAFDNPVAYAPQIFNPFTPEVRPPDSCLPCCLGAGLMQACGADVPGSPAELYRRQCLHVRLLCPQRKLGCLRAHTEAGHSWSSAAAAGQQRCPHALFKKFAAGCF